MDFKKEICTVPNLLTLLRLALIPVYTSIYRNAGTSEEYALAAGILAFSCLTDFLDGLIARRFHMITMLGKFLDPLADKLTQLSLLCSLSAHYSLVQSLIPLFLIKLSKRLMVNSPLSHHLTFFQI